MRLFWIQLFQNLKRSYDNAIFSNEKESCKEKFTCDGVLGFLFFQVQEVENSLLQIHSVVNGAKIFNTYDFGDENRLYQTKQWYQSMASEIIIDFIAEDKSSNFTLDVECRNIELLHNQDALVYFQRKSKNSQFLSEIFKIQSKQDFFVFFFESMWHILNSVVWFEY